jgi:ABC-2 type transport system ATP-binding protein
LTVIETKGISKIFKGDLRSKPVKALDCLDVKIEEGEVFGFLGPNGAGKSTFIKILLNLIYPDSGIASILGKDVGDKNVRKNVGYLPENPYFYDYLTAEELLWFAGRTSGMLNTDIKHKTDMLLARINLQQAKKRQIRTYSKGMVQRAGLAMALIHDPKIIILDEPMNGLDPIGRKMVVDLILELKSAGKTIFFSSHILTDIERLCDRAGIIVNGRLRLVDTLENLLADEDTLEDVFLREVRKAEGEYT